VHGVPADVAGRHARAREAHAALLERWRTAMDLVGPGPLAPHLDDADAAVADLDARGDWVDLGSGAGFPGVALAARWPEARVQLVERRQKRAAFLEQVVAAAGLSNASVHCVDSATLPAGAYDGVVSRAYKPPAELLPEAARLLRPGGLLVLLLAREPAPAAPGWSLAGARDYSIEGKPRRVVVLRRQA
jgi:16S rRNA (guanine527-N7)-methyltransferase